MSNKTRKHIWPGALVASLAIVGVLAALLVLTWNPMVTEAHGGGTAANHCSDINNIGHDVAAEIAGTTNADGSAHTCANPGTDDGVDPGNGSTGTPIPPADPPAGAMFSTGSTSASASIEVKVTIDSLAMAAEAGSSVEVYLEDDFQVPDSIDRDTVYFAVTSPRTPDTNDGGRVYATDPIDIDDADHFGGDDDWSIRVYIPDMNTSDDADGYQGPIVGQTVTLVFTKSADIKNPSEASDAGDHSAAYRVLDANGDANGDGTSDVNSDSSDRGRVNLPGSTTVAKIALDDDDNVRGFDLTVTGSGFNNGVTADVYVLSGNDAVWNTLDCAQMNLAAGSSDTMGNGFCRMYADLTAAEKATVDDLDFSDNPAEAAVCAGIIAEGANPGNGTVGSDDKIATTFEVTVPTFMRGDQNYICMVDGEGRASTSDVEKFKLEPSIRVVPSTVSAGDTVNVFAQDFPTDSAVFEYVKLANKNVEDHNGGEVRERSTIGVRRFGHGDVRRSGRSERHHQAGRRVGRHQGRREDCHQPVRAAFEQG